MEGWRPISLDPYATRHHLLEGLTLCGGFFLCLALVNSQRRVVLLLQVLVFSGTFQAVYGAFMVLSGLEYGFLVEKYSGRGVATGTFVNRNHLAGYLNMCLAAGIGLLLSQLATRSPRNWRERARAWLQLLLSPKMRLRIYIAIMVVTLVLTRARMGNIAFFTALAVAGLIALYASRQIGSSYNFNWRLAIFLASLFLVDMLILGKWFGFDELLERLSQTNAPQEARVQSSAYAADYLQAFPLTGSGAGSFYGVFQNFQQPDLRGLYLHAHNDYLEFAVELGVPAAVLLGAILPWAGFTAYQLQRRENPLARGVGFAVTMTLVWVTMHSATDFNLQIAANSLTFLTLLALTFCCRGLAVK
ncbi:MAG: O-antigen ligase family protein [Pseudomonadota bacterium]